MKTFGFLLWTFVLAVAIDITSGEIENGFAKRKADPTVINISVISSDKAHSLFRKFAQDKNIPFKYPIDGCHARAMAMAKIAEEEKIEMGKVYAEGSLQVKTDIAKYPIVKWGWHVAPVAYVKQINKDAELMVFDPSLFAGPVSVEEWKQKMLDKSDGYKPTITEVYYGNRFQYFPRFREKYKSRWKSKDLRGYQKMMQTYLKFQDVSPSFGYGNSYPTEETK